MATNIHDEINRRMVHFTPLPEQTEVMIRVRERFIELAHWVADTIPQGREASMALTNIELAMRDAIAAIHHGDVTVERIPGR